MGFFPRGINATLYNPGRRSEQWRRDAFGTDDPDEARDAQISRPPVPIPRTTIMLCLDGVRFRARCLVLSAGTAVESRRRL